MSSFEYVETKEVESVRVAGLVEEVEAVEDGYKVLEKAAAAAESCMPQDGQAQWAFALLRPPAEGVKAKVAAGVVVSEQTAVPEGLESIVLPAGSFSVGTAAGDQKSLLSSWTKLKWEAVKAGFSTKEPSGVSPSFELHSRDPRLSTESGFKAQLYQRVEKTTPLDLEYHGVKALPAMRFAGLARDAPFGDPQLFMDVGKLAGEAGLFCDETKMAFLTMRLPEGDKPPRGAACVIVSEDTTLPDSLEEFRLRASDYGRCTLKGPYDNLYRAWVAFMDKLKADGYEALDTDDSDPCLEIYLNDPTDTKPSELLTELRCLVRKIAEKD